MSSVPKAASKTIPLEEQEQCYKSDQLKRLDLGRLKATASKIPGLLSQGKELKMENLTEELYVGDASASMKDWFQKQLIKVYMEKMHNEEMAKKCVHIGPLKKFDRIYAKTVNYAVENESKEPILPRVRDILRGTIVFGEDNLRNGDNIIDVVGKVFGAENIIQVKNRFLSGRLPSLPKSWQMRDWSIQHNYIGKDLCYRDLQILVRIPCQHDQMKSIVGEIQIAVEAVFNLKHEGGHKAYKIVRRVLEYEEAKKKILVLLTVGKFILHKQ